jgi:hypothetical protein
MISTETKPSWSSLLILLACVTLASMGDSQETKVFRKYCSISFEETRPSTRINLHVYRSRFCLDGPGPLDDNFYCGSVEDLSELKLIPEEERKRTLLRSS